MEGDKRGPAGCHPSILLHRVMAEKRDGVGGERVMDDPEVTAGLDSFS